MAEEQAAVEAAVQEHADVGRAEWTGLAPLKALRWREDSEEYSASSLTLEILRFAGLERRFRGGRKP
jgi:hypothetical protein